jgi:hypothetical protein
MPMAKHRRNRSVARGAKGGRHIPEAVRVSLDHRLIYDARARTNGTNVHQMKELIFAYELAVSLHNDGHLFAHKCSDYDPTWEIELRKAVLKSRMEEFHSIFAAAARTMSEIRNLSLRSRERLKLS